MIEYVLPFLILLALLLDTVRIQQKRAQERKRLTMEISALLSRTEAITQRIEQKLQGK